MGAAQSNMRPAGVVLPVSYLGELGSEIQYEKSMGSSRFLKSIKARHRSGAFVVKVFVKLDSHMDLRPTSKRIAAERAALLDCPNVLPYSQALATERAGYLLRQWLASNLYDRISTRPFLSNIEKKWIAFQLLTAVRDVHSRKVSHGDIKSENILVTSWNWIYLTDFSSAFKPTYIPEDDPSDFSYFFDTSGRRTCYLAPERFYSQDSDIGRRKSTLELGRSLGKVTEAMDVFSLGCVIGELFMEGTPPFTLAQLLKYRSGEYSLDAYLAQIEDQDVRTLVRSMTSLHPEDRSTCEQYYTEAYGRLFPSSFYDYFYDFIAATNEFNASSYQSAMTMSRSGISGSSTPQIGQTVEAPASIQETDTPPLLPTNADEIINRIWSDYEHIEKHLRPESRQHEMSLDEQPHTSLHWSESIYPVKLHLVQAEAYLADKRKDPPNEDGPALLMLSLACANVRNCLRPSSILKGLDLMVALSDHLTDETKLDRMLPYVVALMQNDLASVRAAALRTLTQTLMTTNTITPSNAAIFPQFILPNILPMVTDPDDFVRCLLAQSLAALAECGQSYLDMTQAMKAEGTFKLTKAHDFDGAPYEMSYDAALADLQAQIHEIINTLLIDNSSAVRRALVANITPLCVFLGRARTADVLGLMTTHLNDRDWRLRSAFFGSMVGLSTCISVKSVDEYIIPLLTAAIADNEESVTARDLNSLATLTALGLHPKRRIWETILMTLPLLYHPNAWLRSGVIQFLASAATQMSETERWCGLYPGLRKILQSDIGTIDEVSLLSATPAPITRQVYEAAVTWAGRMPRTPMWTFSHGLTGMALGKAVERLVQAPTLSSDDKAELQRMHSMGMSENDSYKILAMRAYVTHVAAVRQSAALLTTSESPQSEISLTEEVALATYGVTPQNIIFSATGNERNSVRTSSADGWGRPLMSPDSHHSQGGEFSRPNGGRSVSGSSTADALRRRLVMANASSTSLNSIPASSSPRQAPAMPRSHAPLSPGSVAHSDRSSTSSIPAENLGDSSATIRAASVAQSSVSKQRNTINIHGVEMSKAAAAVAADSVTATGHLTSEAAMETGSISGYSTPIVGSRKAPVKVSGNRFSSTYEGDDPAIKQLLDRVYLDSYREPMPEFGPFVPEKALRRRAIRPGARERLHRSPEGLLIAHLAEHTAAVAAIAVSPDHLFFATGSDDGSVKIWDTTRLEKNVTSRSRQSIQQGGRITALCILENSHCVASASTEGSIWVSRVDVAQQTGGVPRYGKASTIRQHQLDSSVGDYATCMLHYDTDSASKLVYATQESKIVVLDIRTLRMITNYSQPSHLGPISCLCLDRKRAWLLTGTLKGYLTLWDLRFGLLLRTWKTGSETTGAVHACNVHTTKGKGRWVIVAIDGSESFETWDIETGQCVERYVPIHTTVSKTVLRDLRRQRAGSTGTVRSHGLSATSEGNAADAIESLLAGADETKPTTDRQDHHDLVGPSAQALHAYQYKADEPAIKAILNGSDYANSYSGTALAVGILPTLPEVSVGQAEDTRVRPPETGWVISAGEDKRIRFWDLAQIEKSSVVVGGEDVEDKAIYASERIDGMTLFTESRLAIKNASSSVKRGNITAASQQNLLKAHQDAITALALLELPFKCVVSADRSGVIKVWE